MTELTLTTPVHDKDMARDFLSGLDPTTEKFTFQFFSDGPGGRHAEIFHGTLDEVWLKIQALNTPEQRVGVFVTINETDFNGRRNENIVRARALFADADSDEQITRSMKAIEACGAAPSMIVNSGRGRHFYYVCPEIPREQFSPLQKSLIDKLGTDPAITDLPRVMRLPGTLHLKDPTKPRLVELCRTNGPIRRWTLSELVEKLKLDESRRSTSRVTAHFSFEGQKQASAFASLPMESLADGIERPEMPPLDWEPLEKPGGCAFIRDALRTGGKEYTQPMWNLTTLTATFLQGGEKLAHKMGDQHPGYTKESTDALWERKQRERREKGLAGRVAVQFGTPAAPHARAARILARASRR
jgi:hypothetical protein